MNLARGSNIYIIRENIHMYSQLLVSSGDGMQKLCKVMDNWIW